LVTSRDGSASTTSRSFDQDTVLRLATARGRPDILAMKVDYHSNEWLPWLANNAERLIVKFLQEPPMSRLYSKGERRAFTAVDLDVDSGKPDHQGTRRSWEIS